MAEVENASGVLGDDFFAYLKQAQQATQKAGGDLEEMMSSIKKDLIVIEDQVLPQTPSDEKPRPQGFCMSPLAISSAVREDKGKRALASLDVNQRSITNSVVKQIAVHKDQTPKSKIATSTDQLQLSDLQGLLENVATAVNKLQSTENSVPSNSQCQPTANMPAPPVSQPSSLSMQPPPTHQQAATNPQQVPMQMAGYPQQSHMAQMPPMGYPYHPADMQLAAVPQHMAQPYPPSYHPAMQQYAGLPPLHSSFGWAMHRVRAIEEEAARMQKLRWLELEEKHAAGLLPGASAGTEVDCGRYGGVWGMWGARMGVCRGRWGAWEI